MERCPSCNSPVETGQKFCRKCGYSLQSTAARTTHLAAGTMLLSRYQIIGEIAESAAAVTYRAFDTLLQYPVAIREFFPTALCTRLPGSTNVMLLGAESAVFEEGKQKFNDEALRLARFRDDPGYSLRRCLFPAGKIAGKGLI